MLPSSGSPPAGGQEAVRDWMEPGERLLAVLETDLDARLRFRAGLVAVTNRRVIARAPEDDTPRAWPHAPGLRLELHDHAGAAELALTAQRERLAAWRFTLGRAPAARKLVLALGGPAPGDTEAEDAQEDDGDPAPASARSLLRLWRFARPYGNRLLLGLVLTLGSTAAALVPPYLTMPLMDRVLVPWGNGTPIDWPLVRLLLGALLASAVCAWALGWARTYVLALVSERIGADLRNATFEHLLGLSLDDFGGRRTGDLMSRIGAETDRICLFLSLHLLDFVTDVLMIALTVMILLSIDPGLALAALLPLPFIAWLIHLVRDRLRRGFERVDRVWGEVNNVLADTIPGIRVVKAFGQEGREAARFR
ncbi:MAG: ABC transporter transmembrane domain-containing protein, partial [Betaproteobacteria bacterium]